MSANTDRIAQFRKMATDDPDNELGHYRLGQLLTEDGLIEDAVASFRRTIEISPTFSKPYQLLGECLIKLDRKAEAIELLTRGYTNADERGDKMPRDAMAKLLADLGAPIPTTAPPSIVDDGQETGFRCERPGCPSGKRAKPLAEPPFKDEIGGRIARVICAECWKLWKDQGVKVINELRLDLSSEFGQSEYDKYMREYLGFEEAPAKDH